MPFEFFSPPSKFVAQKRLSDLERGTEVGTGNDMVAEEKMDKTKISIILGNIHCPSCVATITDLLSSFNAQYSSSSADAKAPLPPIISDISVSIVFGTVTFYYSPSTNWNEGVLSTVEKSLTESGFEVLQLFEGEKEVVGEGLSTAHTSSSYTDKSTTSSNDMKKFIYGFPSTLWSSSKRGSAIKKPSTKVKRNEGGGWVEIEKKRLEKHKEHCAVCQEEEKAGKGKEREHDHEHVFEEKIGLDEKDMQRVERKKAIVRFAIGGMTCSSCVNSINSTLSNLLSVYSSVVTLQPGSALVTYDPDLVSVDQLRETIEDIGFDAQLVEEEYTNDEMNPNSDDTLKEVIVEDPSNKKEPGPPSYKISLSIGGMTCMSCSQGIISSLKELDFLIGEPEINSANGTGMVIVREKEQSEMVIEVIEDGGYDVKVVEVVEQSGSSTVSPSKDKKLLPQRRQTRIGIQGMFCNGCVLNVNSRLEKITQLYPSSQFTFTPVTLSDPFSRLSYFPSAPAFTLRTIKSTIEEATHFTIYPAPPPSLEDLSQQSHKKHQKRILIRIIITFLFSIPTFIIAIIGMSILPSNNSFRSYWDELVWGGSSRGTIALWILATPIQFGVGWFFHERTLRSFYRVWKPRKINKGDSKARRRLWADRLLRWGSMDSLVTLGTTVAYFASVAYMVLDITAGSNKMKMGSSSSGSTMGYFDAPIFLMFFILLGRYLEGIARQKAGDAVRSLKEMRPEMGLLLHTGSESESKSSNSSGFPDRLGGGILDEKIKEEGGAYGEDEKKGLEEKEKSSGANLLDSQTPTTKTEEVLTEMLEIGDTILIPVGESVPLDSVLLPQSLSSTFDESSLTGESRPALKSPPPPPSSPKTDNTTSTTSSTKDGSLLYATTINLGPSAIQARIISQPGSTTIDQIATIVREAMTKKGQVEKLADISVAYFVPCIVGISLFTWGVWILRGYLGGLDEGWLGGDRRGGWSLFAIQFGVAVLVVACPCGIGLAAPTAQMVSTGLSARYGILAVGGGESFQAATKINCVVFDKTGTLTTGEFKVTDDHLVLNRKNESIILGGVGGSGGSGGSEKNEGDDVVGNPNIGRKRIAYGLVAEVERTSRHPLAVGITRYCDDKLKMLLGDSKTDIKIISSEEVAGRGIVASCSIGFDGSSDSNESASSRSVSTIEVVVGNERLMKEKGVEGMENVEKLLNGWKKEANSVILVAGRQSLTSSLMSPALEEKEERAFHLISLFSLSDPPRAESASIIQTLRSNPFNIQDICMLTGDNDITAKATAKRVGIKEENVWSGCLPVEKQDVIKELQQRPPNNISHGHGNRWIRFFTQLYSSSSTRSRSHVLFTGDGLNDSASLSQSDLGVSLSSGSQISISASDFCLLNANNPLNSLPTLLSLAKKTNGKVWQNLIWAVVWNMALIPIAAGAFYGVQGKKIRLPPVYAALAMALSSISVVSNSLSLRMTFKPHKTQQQKNHM